MGQCFGKKSSNALVSEDIGTVLRNDTKASAKDVEIEVSESTASDDKKAEDYALTKGSSMFLPDKDATLERGEGVPGTDEFAFLDEPGALDDDDEDYDNPLYATTANSYKVGDEIEYAPPMDENVSFELQDSADGPSSVLTFGYKTLQGRSAAFDKANQDSLAIMRQRDSPDTATFGVFDGHGPYGQHASHFCRMNIAKEVNKVKSKKPKAKTEDVMKEALLKMDKKFGATNPEKANKVDPIVSGTTVVTVTFEGKDIIATNIGDSRAILGTKQDDGSVEVTPLTDDHKPARESEYERISKSSALIKTEREMRGLSPIDDPEQKVYVCRTTEEKGIIYAVLFSRSLGDVDAHRHLGVITEPEFFTAKIDDTKEQAVIIASDGVWDMMSNEEVTDCVFKHADPLKACEEIVSVSSIRWAESEERRRDDITVQVIGIGESFVQGDRKGSFFTGI